MPDENANPVGTTQTSQNDQPAPTQSSNDFVLDFGDFGEDKTPTTDVEVDSSLNEEEKSDDGLGFDIDLGSDDQNASENTEEGINTENDNSVTDVTSVEATQGEEEGSDFDISIDFNPENEEAVSENEEIIPENEEIIPENEEIVPENEEIVPENEEIVPENEEMIPENEEIVPENEEIIPENEEIIPENEEIVPENEEIIPENEEIIPESEEIIPENEEIVPENEEIVPESEEIIPENEEGSLNFVIGEDTEPVSSEVTDEPREGQLFHQINEDDQNEISFDLDNTDKSDENIEDQPLSIGSDDVVFNEAGEFDGEITFDLPEVEAKPEGLAELNIEPTEQRQPELGDLLSNSPIDLSKELNDTPESDLGSLETPVSEEVETRNQTSLEEVNSEEVPEAISEPTLEDTTPEAPVQEATGESAASLESNEFLLDVPQVEPESQNTQEILQSEPVENSIDTQSQEQPQVDERSKVVNNTVQMDTQNTETSEINVSAPVELSDVSSSQREAVPTESEVQVQSTLSLDQILDSELLSNPQYSDNSKASPQNLPASGGGSKKGLFIGIGVAALACCVAVLAFPSIGFERKSGDTVSTGTIVETPVEEPYLSAPDKPDNRGDPIVTDYTETPEIGDLTEDPVISGGEGSAQAVSFPEDDDSGDGEVNTEPVPYVWTDDGQSDDPIEQEPVVEEIEAYVILDVISSFKSQAETYYSHGEQHADNQLMKYAQRLLSVCDNYSDKVNNGEGLDSESLASFKSTANKIITKINTYLGGDEEVPVIREATIDGESYFEGKDELKDYIYNNR